MRSIRVGIIARSLLDREGLVVLLGGAGGIAPFDLGNGAAESLERATQLAPDIVLLDLDVEAAAAFARALRAQNPEARLLAVLRTKREDEALRLGQSGVAGFLSPDSGLRGCVQSLRAVIRSGSNYPPEFTEALLRATRARAVRDRALGDELQSLTPREREIVGLMAQGLTNKEIADRLSIHLGTAKHHVHGVLAKLGIQHRWEVAMPSSSPRGTLTVVRRTSDRDQK